MVLLHSTEWLTVAGLNVPFLVDFNATLSTLRMPLFFVLAGLFAEKWIVHKSWTELWAEKLSMLYWTFLVWSAVAAVFLAVSLGITGGSLDPLRAAGALALSLVRPRGELWFIWALALFFMVAKFTKRAPLWAQMGIAAVLSASSFSGVVTGNIGWVGAGRYYVFFLTGLYFQSRIFAFADRFPLKACLTVIVAWAPTAWWVTASPLRDVPGLLFLCSIVGAMAGICLSKLLLFVTALRSIGVRTLPIYLIHTPLVILAALALAQLPVELAPLWMRAAMPSGLAWVAILMALGVHRAGKDSFLFRAPRWFVARGTLLFSSRGV